MNTTKEKRAYAREYYHRTRDKRVASRKAYEEANKEKIAERISKQRKTPEAKALAKANYEKHKHKHLERRRLLAAEYRAKNPEASKETNLRSFMKRAYGITPEEKQEIFAAQGSCCAICGTTDNRGREWHTDHCHTTKRVRGVLCNHCNLMLGHARDNPDVLTKASNYLRCE